MVSQDIADGSVSIMERGWAVLNRTTAAIICRPGVHLAQREQDELRAELGAAPAGEPKQEKWRAEPGRSSASRCEKYRIWLKI